MFFLYGKSGTFYFAQTGTFYFALTCLSKKPVVCAKIFLCALYAVQKVLTKHAILLIYTLILTNRI